MSSASEWRHWGREGCAKWAGLRRTPSCHARKGVLVLLHVQAELQRRVVVQRGEACAHESAIWRGAGSRREREELRDGG